MPAFSFDIISDLHVAHDEEFSWEGQPTALYAIVTGDLSKDRETALSVLRELARVYKQVFYIDGNAEHRYNLEDIEASYEELEAELDKIENVVYLHNKVIISNGVAIVGTNGWYDFGFDDSLDILQCLEFVKQTYNISEPAAEELWQRAVHDSHYLVKTIEKLQKHRDVKYIIIATHTVPLYELIGHDPVLTGTYKINLMGNSGMRAVLDADTESKITHWIFGHYHGRVDRAIEEVRFVNNPKGRASDQLNTPYFPKRVELRF